jgi:uncharacterized protein YdhG (YjbR/CyaY superfamily)
MAMPRRNDVDDFFNHLDPIARPHLDELRRLSRAAAPIAREELKWNLPAYVLDSTLWLLQAFKQHAALRFPLRIVGAHRAEIEAAGYPAGAGMIKLPYDRELPVDLLTLLMKARFDEYQATGAKWSGS